MVEEWTKVKNDLLGDCAEMELITTDNTTVCKFYFKEKEELASHSHSNEQITIVQEGQIEMEFLGKKKVLSKDDVCIIPSNVIHSGKILEVPFRSYDIFSPIRNDFLDKIISDTREVE